MSLERVPKFSYYFFRSQRDADEAGPSVFIATYWTAQSPLQVRVFGNAEEVELLLNGRRIGRKRGDADRTSAHLRHPPFSFQIPAFEPGTLEAVGFIKGEGVARHRVSTPQAAERLEIELDDAGVCSAPGDLVFARARVLDRAGTVVPVSGRAVRFKAEAPLNIVGDAEVLTEAGVASALVQIRGVFAKAALSAASDGMSAARDVLPRCLPTSP
jgi:beta-galactosidase